MAITQAVVLLVVNYERLEKVYSLIVFSLVSVIVLGAMVGVMRATKPGTPGQAMAVFDQATTRWGSWAYLITAVGVLAALGAVAKGLLPQRPLSQVVQFIRADDYEWSDKSAGKKVIYKLSTPDGVPFPNPLWMVAKLKNGPVSFNWEIKQVVGYSNEDLAKAHETGRQGPAKESYSTSDRFVGMWQDLVNREYFFVVEFHAIGTGLPRTDLDKLIVSGKEAISITLHDAKPL